MENEFKELLARCVTTHPNIEKLIDYLSKSDFFIAPASSKFHENYPRGLLEHSIRVYKILKDKVNYYNNMHPHNNISDESCIITALLHDVCKIDFYQLEYRNVKDESTHGMWEKRPFYKIVDGFPFGHGEKSVYIINKYITLTDEEAMAIRWHMGFSEPPQNYTALGDAFRMCPLAILLHEADLEATYKLYYEKEV